MRLNKYLSHCGVDSRRKCDALILEGRVMVDGSIETNPGTNVDEHSADIRVDGERVHLKKNYSYIKMNKPAGYITSLHDPYHSQTVMQLLPKVLSVVPVGRLDKDSTGILIFTDDGDLNYRLTHPKHGVEKVYEVLLRRPPEGYPENDLPQGIILQDNGDKVQGKAELMNRKRNHYRITLKEGKKREVKRIFLQYNSKVTRLHRNSFAGISADELPPGKWKKLTPAEIAQLRSAANA